jgi:Fe-S oxidoreductase
VQYIKEGRIKLDRSRFKGPATYHDWILEQCMENWVDLYPTRMDQICCGGGGGALVTGYDKERIFYARKKMDQIRASGAKMLVVPCHSCHGQFNNIKKQGLT